MNEPLISFGTKYLTYAEYEELGGKLLEMPFNLLEYKSRKKIDEKTFGRISELSSIPNEVKLCVNDLINVFEDDEKPILANDGVGDYNPTKRSVKEIENIKDSIIEQYLGNLFIDDVRATYCGVD